MTNVVLLTTYPEVSPAKAIMILPIPIHNKGLAARRRCSCNVSILNESVNYINDLHPREVRNTTQH